VSGSSPPNLAVRLVEIRASAQAAERTMARRSFARQNGGPYREQWHDSVPQGLASGGCPY
jgi:hypothetical protein